MQRTAMFFCFFSRRKAVESCLMVYLICLTLLVKYLLNKLSYRHEQILVPQNGVNLFKLLAHVELEIYLI